RPTLDSAGESRTAFKLVQSAKALASIFTTLVGISTCSRPAQSAKAASPMILRFDGKSKAFNDRHELKAASKISVHSSGSSMSVRAAQFSNERPANTTFGFSTDTLSSRTQSR